MFVVWQIAEGGEKVSILYIDCAFLSQFQSIRAIQE